MLEADTKLNLSIEDAVLARVLEFSMTDAEQEEHAEQGELNKRNRGN